MKQIICFLLCFLFVFSLCACSKGDSDVEHDVDIEYYAKLGKIPECEFALGADIDALKEKMEERLSVVESGDHSHGEFAYTFIEGEQTALVDCGVYRYYYYKDSKAGGVSFIASFEDAYGFKMGDSITEIRKILKEFDYKESTLNDDNSFFLNGSAEGVCLSAEFDKYTVSFIFVDNALTATAIYDGSQW